MLAVLASIVCTGLALAAKPKKSAFYADNKKQVTLSTLPDRSIEPFQAQCPAKTKFKYRFDTISPIKVKSNGKFHWSGLVSVNTPTGGALAKQSRLVITGKFVSSKKATGSFKLHKGSCKTTTFVAKLETEG